MVVRIADPDSGLKRNKRRSTIGLKVSTKRLMDECRAPGQCYDGFIQQMVEHWEKSRGAKRF